MLDPLHGSLNTPRTFAPQVDSASTEVVAVAGRRYRDVQACGLTSWHYYACRTR
jgi:hypothetical protein